MALHNSFRHIASALPRRSIPSTTTIINTPLAATSAACRYSLQPRRSMVSVAVDETSGIGTMTMTSPPVNSITLEFMEAFISTLDEAVKNPACKGLILTSGVPRVFSGGLDILTMYNPDVEKARLFWYTFQRLWMDLYLSPIPTVAALNGAAPAGGTILACSCDYRVMDNNPKLRMGLNETLLGIVAPWWTVKMFVATVGQREAERALALGRLYSPAEALAVGLVDEAVESSAVAATAEAELKKWMGINAGARFATKKLLRTALVDELLSFDREKDIDMFIDVITAPKTQKVMGAYLAQLQGQKAKKN